MKMFLRSNARAISGDEAGQLKQVLRANGFSAVVLGSEWEPIFPPVRPRAATVRRPAHIPRALRTRRGKDN